MEKYSTEVVLRPYRSELTMLDGRNEGAGGGGYDTGAGGGGGGFSSGGGGGGGGSFNNDLDDEIPF